jgi:phage shock protein A
MSSPTKGPPIAGRSAGVGEYLKRAFLQRWNVLAFAGGAVASLLSPWPDACFALIAAGELVYLTQLVSNTKFRDAVDAQVYHEGKEQQTAATAPVNKTLQEVVAGLSHESRRRFESLRARCLEMRTIADGVRGRTSVHSATGEDLNTSALDKLLWVFLRLLVSQEALGRFLDRTDVQEIRARLDEAKARLEAHKEGDERIVRSLQDSVAVQEMRLENYDRAKKNSEFVRIELDRIEGKIQALTEASVNRQDPDFLSSQIDSVSESMQTTERAISELQHITGLVDEMQEPPAILGADLGKVTQ